MITGVVYNSRAICERIMDLSPLHWSRVQSAIRARWVRRERLGGPKADDPHILTRTELCERMSIDDFEFLAENFARVVSNPARREKYTSTLEEDDDEPTDDTANDVDAGSGDVPDSEVLE